MSRGIGRDGGVAARNIEEKGGDANLEGVALLPVALSVQEVSGDLREGERTKQELVPDTTAAMRREVTVSCTRADFKSSNDLVVLRLGDNVEHLVDFGGLELTGTAKQFSS